MKKRNRRNHSSILSSADLRDALVGRNKRRRRVWTFERLEERQLFSVSPLGQVGPAPDANGALTSEQVTMGEMWWSFKQASELGQYSTEQLQNTTQWAVWTVDEINTEALTNPYLGHGTISTLYNNGLSSADIITQLSGATNVAAFYPLIEGLNAVKTASPLDEPLFEDQWHLRNTGQIVNSPGEPQELHGLPGEDINVVGAWNQDYSGNGVVVGVVDSGFQTNHPDLSANNRADLATAFGGAGAGSHGTAVAGIIGANGNNNNGIVGIAYNVDLVNVDIGTDTSLSGYSAAVLNYRNDVIDIYNMSFGEGTDGRNYAPLTPTELFNLRKAVLFGRPDENGTPLGNIFVVSSGNDGGTDFFEQGFATSGHWDSANYNGMVSSRYTIGVGAVDHDGAYYSPEDGTYTNYPEAGSSVLVVAPTGSVSLDVGLDTGTGSGIWTTDLTGNNGYNQAGNDDGDFLADTNYSSRFNGTSAAAPIVSGVVALMLEANPNLTWRDVQEILLRSARQNDRTDEGWRSNLYEFWESPSNQLILVDPMDPSMGFKQIPMEDPFERDDVDPSIDPDDFLRTEGSPAGFILGLKPIDNYSLYQMPRFDNGAGYTVHDARGIYTEEYGYAHGVVDASLAVQLAKNWTLNEQDLAPELTFTTFARVGDINIPGAAEVGPDGDDDRFIVPGILGGSTDEDFHEYYDEFFGDMPFDGDEPPVDDNGTPLPFNFLSGFNPPLMQVEWLEVKVTLSGVDMNALRIAVRSPDGTISDLNMMAQDNTNTSINMNDLDQDLLRVGLPTAPGGSTFVFSTNRHWGERNDDFFEIDPDTGSPVVDVDTNFDVFRTWDLIIENYSMGAGTLNGFEIVFHGTPLSQGAERIMGHVGLDIGTADDPSLADDGDFNFERSIGVDVDSDGTIDTRTFDPNQEAFAGGTLVRVANVNAPNVILDQFITGADGNFYFDLAPGTYNIQAIAPEGYSSLDDTGLDPRYQEVWTITIDPNDNFTRTAGRAHDIDDNGDNIKDSLDPRYDYYNDVNFLFKAEASSSTDVTVNGFVFSDVNGDGAFNGTDTEGKNFHVYADINKSGAFEAGEPETFTSEMESDAGQYHLVVPGISTLQEVIVVAEPLTPEWIPTSPVTGKQTLLQTGGGIAYDVDFGFRPPLNSSGGAADDPGTILGVVYNDKNGNGVEDATDNGVPNVRVFVDLDADGQFDYVDANANNQFDDGEDSEPTDLTNEFGGFFLAEVDPGPVKVFVVAPTDWSITAPALGYFQDTLEGGGQINNVSFGIKNLATHDFGDLPDSYGTTLAANGPRHRINSGFRLGNVVDGEIEGKPTLIADGDDLAALGDEDGVTLPNGSLVAGQINTVQVTLSGVGGYLNAWFDVDASGTFDADEHLLIDADLNPGTRLVEVSLPADMANGPIATRFRWGTAGLDSFGSAIIGEVEDYFLPNSVAAKLASPLAGDYDGNLTVGPEDYLVWRGAYGTANLAADGNGDGVVDAADYTVWRNNYVEEEAGGGGGALSSALADNSDDSSEELNTEEPVSLAGLQFSTVVSPLDSTPSMAQSPALESVASDAELELLDHVLAGIQADDDEDASADPLAIGDSDDEDSGGGGGLALAAAFDEVTEWRYGL